MAATPVVLCPSAEQVNVLDASLTAESTTEGVELQLTAGNEGDDAVTLSFRDAQRAEFVATDDQEVWRWSDGRMFTMATGSETLEPGEDVSIDATWPDPPSGEYEVRAWLTAEDADAAAEASVAVA